MIQNNYIKLNNRHRIALITLLILQYIIFSFAQLFMIHFHSIPIPFIQYHSLTSTTNFQHHYFKNMILYCLFWGQHILMATLKYKMSWFSKTKYFVLYDRYLYNIASGLTLWFIFSQAQTSYQLLFIIPDYICFPFVVFGLIILIKSIRELGGGILNPYKIRELISAKEIHYESYTSSKNDKLKTDGIYGYTRNPMQAGAVVLLIFGNGIYTIDRLIFVIVMCLGVVFGVLMEEKRLMIQFSDYKRYADKVKSRFIPFLI